MMAIKRVVIELDDLQDTEGSTTVPPSLIGKQKALPRDREKTTTPDQQADYEQPENIVQKQASSDKTEIIGRTPADVVVAFISHPGFVPTVLTVIAFIIAVSKIKRIADFWLPLSIAFILNIVWFAIPRIIRFFKKSKDI